MPYKLVIVRESNDTTARRKQTDIYPNVYAWHAYQGDRYRAVETQRVVRSSKLNSSRVNLRVLSALEPPVEGFYQGPPCRDQRHDDVVLMQSMVHERAWAASAIRSDLVRTHRTRADDEVLPDHDAAKDQDREAETTQIVEGCNALVASKPSNQDANTCSGGIWDRNVDRTWDHVSIRGARVAHSDRQGTGIAGGLRATGNVSYGYPWTADTNARSRRNGHLTCAVA